MSKRYFLLTLALIFSLTLSACGLGQAAEPTATPVDVNAITTAAAATAYAQLTEIASLATPTTEPTNTPEATATIINESTPTIAVEIQITNVAPGTTVALPGIATSTVLPGFPTTTPFPTQAPVGGPPVAACNNFAFVADITVPDGTVFKSAEKFTKVWRIQNTGTCTWDSGYVFKFVGGAGMGSSNQFKFNDDARKIGPNGTVDIDIFMFAPDDPGEYTGNWTMFTDTGQQFGPWISVVIKVVK